MTQTKHSSFHARLLWMMFLLALVPTLLLGTLYYQQRLRLIDSSGPWLASKADAIAASMANALKKTSIELGRAIQADAMQEIGIGALADNLAEKMPRHPEWRGIVWIDGNGHIRTHNRPQSPLLAESWGNILKRHLDQESVFERVHLIVPPLRTSTDLPDGMEETLLLTASLGEGMGVTGIIIDTEPVFAPLIEADRRFHEEGLIRAAIYLYTDEGVEVQSFDCIPYCQSLRDAANRSKSTDPSTLTWLQQLVAEAPKEDIGFQQIEMKRGLTHFGWASFDLPELPEHRWYVAIEDPAGEFVQAVAGDARLFWIATAFFLLLVMPLAYGLQQILIHPLLSMVSSIEKLVAGGGAQPPRITYQEFQPLSEAWHTLTRYIEERRHLLTELEERFQAAESAHQRFQALLQAVPETVLQLDETGLIIECNRAAESLTGYSSETLLGMQVEQLVPEPSRGKHAALRQKYLDAPTTRHMSTQRNLLLQTATGKTIAVDILLAPLNIDGHSQVVALIRDLREERRLQEQLQRLALVAEKTDNMVLVTDAEQRIEWVNAAFERITGYRLAEVVGRQPGELLQGPDTDSETCHQIAEQVENGEPVCAELINYTKAGIPYWVEMNIQPVVVEGELIHFIAIERDITERKQAEERLRNNEARLSEAQRIGHIGSWELDLVTNQLLWSEEIYRIFEIDPEEFGASYEAFVERIHPDDRTQVDQAYRESVKQHTPYKAVHRLLFPKGRIKHVEERGETLYAEDGTPLRSIGTVQDITERVELERKLQQLNIDLELRVAERTTALEHAKDAAEAASRAKSSFLATMSHEIRTPLHGILGTLELLHRSQLEGHQVEMLERSRLSAQNLLAIISDILDFSKIEAGRLELVQQPFPLCSTLEECAISLYPLARLKKVHLLVEMDPSIRDTVLGDDQRLRQVCTNLLSNAIKFTAGRPKARIHLRLRQLARENDSLQVALEVQDNGIGMTPDQLKRVFEPFAQAEENTTRRFGGTGLGLAIITQLVDLMEGRLQVESKPDVGTCFSLELEFPLDIAHPPPPLESLSGERLLLLVADEEVASITGRHLTAAGASVELWKDGATACKGIQGQIDDARVEGSPFTLVITCLGLFGDLQEFQKMAESVESTGLPLLLISDERMTEHLTEYPHIVPLQYPYRTEDLLAQAAVATGRRQAGPATDPRIPKQRLPESEEAAEAEGRLILVAEDNEVNQVVLREQLEQLGFRAVIAADGEEALEHYSSHHFAAVLSDAHMPRMDGHDLVSAIRRLEAGSSERIPVLIITADATPQKAEHCRSAGADDILTKPLALHELHKALNRWLEPRPEKETAPQATTDASTTERDESREHLPVWDATALSQVVGEDETLQRHLLEMFMNDTPALMAAIEAAAKAGNCSEAAAQAHKLKSSARAIGALALGEACHRLENSGKQRKRPKLMDLYVEIKDCFSELAQHLDQRP